MRTSQKTILVVDDDPIIGELLRTVLEDEGYRVALCDRGERALEAVRDTAPDLVILDTLLPDISGWQVLERIRADATSSRLPVLIYSAALETLDSAPPEQAQGYETISKPFDIEELLSKVTSLIGR